MKKIFIGFFAFVLGVSIVAAEGTCIELLMVHESDRKNENYHKRLGKIKDKIEGLPVDIRLKVIKKIETINTSPWFSDFSEIKKSVLQDVQNILLNVVYNSLEDDHAYTKILDKVKDIKLYSDSYWFEGFSIIGDEVSTIKSNQEEYWVYELSRLVEDTKVVYVVNTLQQSNDYQNSFQWKRIPFDILGQYFKAREDNDLSIVASIIQEGIANWISFAPFTDTLWFGGWAKLLSVEIHKKWVRGLGHWMTTGSPEYFLRYMTVTGDKIIYMIEPLDIFYDLNGDWNSNIEFAQDLTKDEFTKLSNACIAWEHRPLCDSCTEYFVDRIEWRTDNDYFNTIRQKFLSKIDKIHNE